MRRARNRRARRRREVRGARAKGEKTGVGRTGADESEEDKKRYVSRDDLISKGPLHCAPRQVRPLQVDWSDLARSIIYIASRVVCVCVRPWYRFVS